MKAICYSAKEFELPFLVSANNSKHELKMEPGALSLSTAGAAAGNDAAIIFAGDDASADVTEKLHSLGVRYIALRSAGYDNVNMMTVSKLGMKAANVPAYSPYAIAEHATMLILALNRKVIAAHTRVHQYNFSLDGLTGFDLHRRTVGIIGTGRIGKAMAKIMHGFGCKLIGFDIRKDEELEAGYGMQYTGLDTLYAASDIITIHTPLNVHTRQLINSRAIAQMKQGVMLINSARGAIVNTPDVIEGLKSGKIGYFGMDVYEKEKGVFFYDHSGEVLQDDMLARLMAFNNVIITPHQGFLTRDALVNIAETTIYNLDCWEKGISSENELNTP